MSFILAGLTMMLLSAALAYKNMNESSKYDPEMMRRHKVYVWGYYFGVSIIFGGIAMSILKVLLGA